MTEEIEPPEPKATPNEMLSDEQRSALEKGEVKPLLNGVWADNLVDGQNLTVGGSFVNSKTEVKLSLDFSAFAPQLESMTPEAVQARFEQSRENLASWIHSTEEVTKRKIDIDPYLFYQLQQVQAVVLNSLAINPKNPPGSLERKEVYQKPNPKLSELVGKGHCAEIAALGQYVLQKIGIDSAYVGGTAMSNPEDEEEYAEAHSFIVIKDAEGHGQYIFDIARPGQHNLPTIFKPHTNFDYETIAGNKEKLVESDETILGEKRYFGVGEQTAGHHNVIS